MPPTRTPVVRKPARNTPACNLAQKAGVSAKCIGAGHIRPRDLLASPPPPRVPTTPSELFTAALLDKDRLGLKTLKGVELLNNVTVSISVKEKLGEVEGCFQDPSTWSLVLRLNPDMFMTPLVVTLDEFTGDESHYRAPTWLCRLHEAPGQAHNGVRSYKWLETYVSNLLTTPHAKVPRVKTWGVILSYVWRIKEVCEPRARPRDPARPLPKPRRVRSANELVAGMAALALKRSGEDQLGGSNRGTTGEGSA